MKKGRTRYSPVLPFSTEADAQEWNINHNEKCDPGGESDYGTIRLLYGNRVTATKCAKTESSLRNSEVDTNVLWRRGEPASSHYCTGIVRICVRQSS